MNLIPDNFDFNAYIEETEQYSIIPAADFVDKTIALFYPPSVQQRFPTMLWDKAKNDVEFRPGEVSLWAGVNGHGKSMVLSQIQLDLAYQGERVLSASFEMTAPRQMQRMCRQAYAGDLPPIPFVNEFHHWTNDRIWIYDHMGAIEWKKVLAVLRYARQNFGITQFVVDSLMKCVKGEEDYNAQKDFVNDLCAFAQANGVHVHLVCHMRKGESEYKMPGKFDIKGSGAITDLVDNIFIVWRNKQAEAKKDGSPTCVIACEKQRHGEFEGKWGFWFDPASQQYLERPDAIPVRYNLAGAKRLQLVS